MLLRTQLKCLSLQENKDFDVWLIDPHYQKRRTIVPELADRFHLDIKHVPYTPNTCVAKVYDCAIFNAPFCYSKAPLNARYSCYRFARPTWTAAMSSRPPGVNLDFHMLAVGPDLYEPRYERKKHLAVWNFDGEDVHWDAIPARSGCDNHGRPNNDHNLSLGNWLPASDCDTGPMPVPMNLYGNLAWNRDQWIALNGTNEIITNAAHWEDLDFDCRAGTSGQQVARRTHLLYRLYHTYGKFSQRSNIQVDVPFISPCAACMTHFRENRGDVNYGEILSSRISLGEVAVLERACAWICRSCHLSGPIYFTGLDDYFNAIRAMKLIRAPIDQDHRIGRNLAILAERMDRCSSLSDKVSIFNDSWSNPDFYQECT